MKDYIKISTKNERFACRSLTPFQCRVYAEVKKIPRGQTCTYKEIAKKIGHPNAARAVGNALNKNLDPRVPCHRVVCCDGKIGGYNRGIELKKKLLENEKKNDE